MVTVEESNIKLPSTEFVEVKIVMEMSVMKDLS